MCLICFRVLNAAKNNDEGANDIEEDASLVDPQYARRPA